ncbi:tyrosine-type recombinase/integrase [Actinomadura miaoliensis]|uniref:tyrosine-type recombinase/integrase n=1 Tax=Actinomadura miaoliensis TaxID=430685 RepID=UPI0031EF31C6
MAITPGPSRKKEHFSEDCQAQAKADRQAADGAATRPRTSRSARPDSPASPARDGCRSAATAVSWSAVVAMSTSRYAWARETPSSAVAYSAHDRSPSAIHTRPRCAWRTGTTVSGYGRDRGHAALDLPVKGGRTRRFVLPPFACGALHRYLAECAPGAPTAALDPDAPLFATRTGRPLDQPAVFRLLRRVAAVAGIDVADQLSPHSLRHSVATLLLDRGHPLHVVQDFLGHADPRTTRRYDQARESLDRSPAYDLGQALAAGVAARPGGRCRHPEKGLRRGCQAASDRGLSGGG